MRQTPFAVFLEHAGYSHDPKTESEYAGRVSGALALAAAEATAREEGFTFEWSIDPDIDSSDWSDDPNPWPTWLVLAATADGDIFASLGGVDFGRGGEPWGNSYARVVEAELALEFKSSAEDV